MKKSPTNVPKQMRVTNEQVEAALQATCGFLALAAQRLGCSYKTVYRRVKASPRLQEALQEIADKNLDLAEAALTKAIRNGESWAVCFYLKCKGKHRGYVERTEVTGRDGGPIEHSAMEKLSDEELDKIIDGD